MISSDIISSGGIDNILKDLYIDESQLEYQRKRYINALNRFTQLYGEGDVFIFNQRYCQSGRFTWTYDE